jgi:hypothetical protein
MRKIFSVMVVMAVMAAAPAQAQHYHGYPSNSWVGPAIGGLALGAIIGGAIAQQQAAPPPVYYYGPGAYHAPPPPMVVQCHTVVAGYDAWRRPILQEICR